LGGPGESKKVSKGKNSPKVGENEERGQKKNNTGGDRSKSWGGKNYFSKKEGREIRGSEGEGVVLLKRGQKKREGCKGKADLGGKRRGDKGKLLMEKETIQPRSGKEKKKDREGGPVGKKEGEGGKSMVKKKGQQKKRRITGMKR